MRFTKMQGCGNDYIVLDWAEAERYILGKKSDEHMEAGMLARFLCDRHYGIGADGLLLVKKGQVADFEMLMFNPDGSRGEMCGNGIRCVGKYLWDGELTKEKSFTVESMGAVKGLTVVETGKDGATILRWNDLWFAVGEACNGFRTIHREAFIQLVCFKPMEAAEFHGGFKGEMPCDAVGVCGLDGHCGIEFSDCFHGCFIVVVRGKYG